MNTEIGEYIVGAYLKIIDQCDFVDFNVRPPGGGKTGQMEFDVLGLNFKSKTAYLCEVATHILGLHYGNGNQDTLDRIAKKHARQVEYSKQYLGIFDDIRYMLWSPYVPVGILTEGLEKIPKLDLIINKKYTAKIDDLRKQALELTHDTGNPFFRSLQILARLRQ